jgi:transcriptional regulator with XRE-family HTH domain
MATADRTRRLTREERAEIEQRLRAADAEGLTHADVAAEFGVSRGRISQIHREVRRDLHQARRVGLIRDALADGVRERRIEFEDAVNLLEVYDDFAQSKNADLARRERSLAEAS